MNPDCEVAQELLTEQEYALYVESCEPMIRTFTRQHLRKSASLCRNLLEHWDEMAETDHDALADKDVEDRAMLVTSYGLSRRKAGLFRGMLTRFNKRLDTIVTTGKIPRPPVSEGDSVGAATTVAHKGPISL